MGAIDASAHRFASYVKSAPLDAVLLEFGLAFGLRGDEIP
jgi:hypothetical protein